MALSHSPSIVIDGLVVHIDAGNIKSYPGSGTTLKDLSKNGYDLSTAGTLNTSNDASAGTIYDHNGSGLIQTAAFTPISSLTWSIIWWIRTTGTPPSNYRGIIRLLDTNAGTGSNYPGYYWQTDQRTTTSQYIHEYQKAWNGTDNQAAWSASNVVDIADWTSQAWFCCGVSHNKPAGGNGVFKAYKNGSLKTTRTNSLANSGYGDINKLLFNTSSGNTIYMGVVSLYDRVLTDLEFEQNFNALKGRYGL
tara:strand:+ start:1468 stop:2214 length:747 start_codon:yes stop_codon:yes gene_type:complete